ncbi:MAG TPA: hypothetical protein VMF31_00645 [Solirubrobacterales bacterium]|nr:hypothetical protein [Solirubrobacterales bacterium]
MNPNETSRSVPAEFEEAGIKPLAYGQPELAKATSYKSLSRQIERDGIQDEAGNDLARPDTESSGALGRQFAAPRTTAAAAFKAPIYKHLQAGTVALVHGPVILTRVNPNLLNPRVGPMVAIPEMDSSGRVAVGWATTDVDVDVNAPERLVQQADSVDELIDSSREAADKVLALQRDLAEHVGREGIEEPLLIVQARMEVGGSEQLPRDLVPLTVDGSSRATIGQEYLADAIAQLLSEKQEEYATKHKRRRALEALERALRAHLPACLIDDPVAERELRDFLVELSSRPAADLVKSKLYAAQRSLVAPAMVVVGFRPNGTATILDAIDQLVANQHKRGPLQWQPAARALDSRNSVVRGLWRQARIGEGRALLLGPRFEEATERFGISANPDFRIGEAVRIFHGTEARRFIREATGEPTAKIGDRAEIITAVIGEQMRNADPEFRRQVETALRDMLVHSPFYRSEEPDMPASDPDPGDLLESVRTAESDKPGELSIHHVELGIKGGIALVMLGALDRAHGTSAIEALRPYAVVQQLVRDSFGQDLLAEAIIALRKGQEYLPALDPETRDPLGRDGENMVIPMDPVNLRQLIGQSSEGGSDEEHAKSTDDIITEAKSVARNTLGNLIRELQEHPDVVRWGIPPHKVSDLFDLLMNQAGDVDYLARRGKEQVQVSADDTEESTI